jgi:hypothetical protein
MPSLYPDGIFYGCTFCGVDFIGKCVRRSFRRFFKVILFLLCALLALAVLAGVAMYAYAAIDKEDGFYIVHAQPVDPDYLLKLDQVTGKEDKREAHFGHAAHRLKAGNGAVLAYRFYSNGNVMRIDDEDFRKMTIWLPAGAPSGRVDLALTDRSKVLVLVSEGGSAWPDNACSGFVSAGTLRIEQRGDRYQVELHGTLAPAGKSPVWPNQCKPHQVDIAFAASQLQVTQLTPWLGSAEGNPYQETYR